MRRNSVGCVSYMMINERYPFVLGWVGISSETIVSIVFLIESLVWFSLFDFLFFIFYSLDQSVSKCLVKKLDNNNSNPMEIRTEPN